MSHRHHTYTGVYSVHATFGRTKRHHLVPAPAGSGAIPPGNIRNPTDTIWQHRRALRSSVPTFPPEPEVGSRPSTVSRLEKRVRSPNRTALTATFCGGRRDLPPSSVVLLRPESHTLHSSSTAANHEKARRPPPLPWIRRSAKHFSAIATRKAPQHCYDHEPADASPATAVPRPSRITSRTSMLTAAVAAALGNLSVAVLPETTRRFFGDWSPDGEDCAPSLLLCQLTGWSQVSTEMFRPPGYGRS